MIKNKKIIFLSLLALVLTWGAFAFAGEHPLGVVLLEPLTDPINRVEIHQVQDLNEYLSIIFPIGIGLAATLAALMIVIGGLEYILGAGAGKKEEGKRRITEAVWGLILALTAYLILSSIDPNLVKLNFTL